MVVYNEQDLGQMGSQPEPWEVYLEVYNLLGQLLSKHGWVELKSITSQLQSWKKQGHIFLFKGYRSDNNWIKKKRKKERSLFPCSHSLSARNTLRLPYSHPWNLMPGTGSSPTVVLGISKFPGPQRGGGRQGKNLFLKFRIKIASQRKWPLLGHEDELLSLRACPGQSRYMIPLIPR